MPRLVDTARKLRWTIAMRVGALGVTSKAFDTIKVDRSCIHIIEITKSDSGETDGERWRDYWLLSISWWSSPTSRVYRNTRIGDWLQFQNSLGPSQLIQHLLRPSLHTLHADAGVML